MAGKFEPLKKYSAFCWSKLQQRQCTVAEVFYFLLEQTPTKARSRAVAEVFYFSLEQTPTKARSRCRSLLLQLSASL